MAANEQTMLGMGEKDFEFLNFQLLIFLVMKKRYEMGGC